MTAPRDQQKPSARKYVADCMSAPFTEIICILTSPLTSYEHFLRTIRNAVSWAIVFFLPPVKLNLQSSRCAFLVSPACQQGVQLLCGVG